MNYTRLIFHAVLSQIAGHYLAQLIEKHYGNHLNNWYDKYLLNLLSDYSTAQLIKEILMGLLAGYGASKLINRFYRNALRKFHHTHRRNP